jgi:hypothetical protein
LRFKTLCAFEHIDQAVQALLPKLAVVLQPVVGGTQARRVEFANAPLRVDLACREIAGPEMEKGLIRSPTVVSPIARRSRMARRVGSARAAKAALRASVDMTAGMAAGTAAVEFMSLFNNLVK